MKSLVDARAKAVKETLNLCFSLSVDLPILTGAKVLIPTAFFRSHVELRS